MNITRKNDAQRFENSAACTAFEYNQPTDEMDMARIELDGRYPDDGWALNTVCASLAYVIKGEGVLLTPDYEEILTTGDQAYIQPNEKYAFDGNMEMLFASTPKWSPDQARHEK